MKYAVTILSLFLSLSLFAQTSVTSGVYSADGFEQNAYGKRTIFAGETRFFSSYELSTITLPIKKINYHSQSTIDSEQVMIVMDGEVKVILDRETKILGRGGVAHILARELFAYENIGQTPATFYVMKFQSKTPADPARGKINGGSVVIRWEDVEVKPTDKGFSRVFYNHPTSMTTKFDMHATTLKAGVASHAPHTHAEEEIVLLLRGKGRMNVDGKFYEVVPGQLVFLASEVSHAIENSGEGELEYFAFQWK
jgi:(S)-ureidoglycine aminohydrolase